MAKFKTYIIIVLVLALAFTVILLMKDRREEGKRREMFLNHFYSAAVEVTSHMEKIISNEKITHDQVHDLQDDLRRLDHTLSAAELYVDNAPHYGNYFNSIAEVLEGWTNNGKKMAGHFAEDEDLTIEEQRILQLVMNDLVQITEAMYSDVTKQEDKTMSMDRFSRLIAPVASADLSILADRLQEQNNSGTDE